MSDGSRVPRTIAAFNEYIQNTDDRLQANNPDTGNPYYKDYAVDAGDATEWHDRRTEWDTKIFPASSNPTTSTSIAKADTKSFMADFRDFATPILNIIEVSKIAGNAEEHIFNFVLHRKSPTRPTSPISEECIASIVSEGRGEYEISCKSTHDASRASKVPGADSILYAHVITNQVLSPLPTPDDGSMIHDIATTSIFHRDFGAENQGKWLVIYFRWYNTKHPNLAGPWSTVQTLAIG